MTREDNLADVKNKMNSETLHANFFGAVTAKNGQGDGTSGPAPSQVFGGESALLSACTAPYALYIRFFVVEDVC